MFINWKMYFQQNIVKGVFNSEISLIVKSAFEITYHLLKHSNIHKHAQTVHRTS